MKRKNKTQEKDLTGSKKITPHKCIVLISFADVSSIYLSRPGPYASC